MNYLDWMEKMLKRAMGGASLSGGGWQQPTVNQTAPTTSATPVAQVAPAIAQQMAQSAGTPAPMGGAGFRAGAPGQDKAYWDRFNDLMRSEAGLEGTDVHGGPTAEALDMLKGMGYGSQWGYQGGGKPGYGGGVLPRLKSQYPPA
jgi:hypothetical protein